MTRETIPVCWAHVKRAPKILALGLGAAVICAACQYSPDMLDRAVSYNRAVADSTNQVLLLNIVRASERNPTYFTRLEGNASSMGITPSANLTLPLTNPRSFEDDINGSPTGAVTSTTTKAIGALGAFAGGLGLQASESNLLTLQNLDDQKYQNGMMTPVPLKNIQAFQDEGYQRDLLFMMFLANVQISTSLIDTIDAAAATRCDQARSVAGDLGGDASFEKQLCDYVASAPYQSLFDPTKAHPAAYSFSLKTCRATGGAVISNDMIYFNNDPAREGRKDAAHDPHPEICFQILLNDLLVLGLAVGTEEDIPAGLVDVVPDAVAENPQFRAQMIQQNFFFRETSTGNTAICKKKNADNGFTLAFTKSEPHSQASQPLSTLFGQLSAPAPTETAQIPSPPLAPPPAPPRRKAAHAALPPIPALPAANAAYPSDPVAACQLKNPGEPESREDMALASTSDAEPRSQQLRPVKLSSEKIAFTTRSFEGMIYYLGEAVRYQESPSADPTNFPRILGRNPVIADSPYVETLFYSSSLLASAAAAVAVRDDAGTQYFLPKSCTTTLVNPGAAGLACSEEYPDNESLQVLNFVNQVWGLQKEDVQGPTSPLVVVNPQ